jgi:NADPH:quinone reductase-like Zn-dependent oxidoreductase
MQRLPTELSTTLLLGACSWYEPLRAFLYELQTDVKKLFRKQQHPFAKQLEQKFAGLGWNVRTSSLSDVKYQSGEQVMILADLEGPTFATIEEPEFESLKTLTDDAKSMIWVSCGGLLSGSNPEHAMALGWSRVVRSEKQLLDLVTLDFDLGISPDEQVANTLLDIATKQSTKSTNENEYRIDRGVVHVSRLIPAESINTAFGGEAPKPKDVPAADNLALKGVLKSGKVLFQNDDSFAANLADEDVDVKVMAVGLNREDSLVVSGSDDASVFSQEISGVVRAIGSKVNNLVVGDRVAGFAHSTLSTHSRTSSKLVQKIADSDSFSEMASIPVAYATAIHALHDLARIEEGDNVLILDGCGAVGVAAIQLCKSSKSYPVVVTSSDATKRLLQIGGLSDDRIINPAQHDILVQIQQVTAGRGANVILASNVSELSPVHECSRTLAPYGRFVMVGKQQGQVANISNLARGASFFTFDLRDFYNERPQILSRYITPQIQLFLYGFTLTGR